MLDERAVLELFDRLLDLLAAVHHDRTPPGNRLVERLTRHQEEPRRRVAGLHPDRIAILEDDEVTVLDDVVGFLVETGPTCQQVGEGRVAPLHGMHEVRVGLEAHVDVFRVDSNILDRPAIPADLPGHDPHPNARRRWTPAPSIVGRAARISATARIFGCLAGSSLMMVVSYGRPS